MRLRSGSLGGLAGLVVGLGASAAIVNCADAPPPPGFENLGGGSGTGSGQGGEEPDPMTSNGPSSGHTATSSTNTSNGTSTVTSTSTSTGTGGLSCSDVDSEPNNTESTAEDLGTTTDCDDDAEEVQGVLEGVSDVDWYKYQGVDEFGISCSVNPVRDLSASAATTLCKYIQCLDEEPDFECPDDTSASTSPDGRPGCCGSQGVTIDFICGGSSLNDDSAWVYISLDTNVNQCVTYTLGYDF